LSVDRFIKDFFIGTSSNHLKHDKLSWSRGGTSNVVAKTACCKLVANGERMDGSRRKGTIQQLQELLLTPPNLLQSSQIPDVPRQPAKQYLDAYQRKLDRLSPLEKPVTMLAQNGKIGAWKHG
jgi:hypothetical protein